MFVRLQMASLIFMMVQAVLFGFGVIVMLSTPLSEFAAQLMPWLIGLTTAVALPISWKIAADLQSRPECQREPKFVYGVNWA